MEMVNTAGVEIAKNDHQKVVIHKGKPFYRDAHPRRPFFVPNRLARNVQHIDRRLNRTIRRANTLKVETTDRHTQARVGRP